MVCSFRTIGGTLLVVTSGMALCSCKTFGEFVEIFNNVVLVACNKLFGSVRDLCASQYKQRRRQL